jgi:hypothetical protein
MSGSGAFYHVNGATAATAATDAHCIVEIWNPSSTRTIVLVELALVAFAAPGAGAGFVTRRSTAKGTAGSTVTPTAEHHSRREAAPDSAFTVEFAAFSVQPTLASGELYPAWVYPAITASGIVLPVARGIEIPPGTGLCICNRAAIAFPTSEVGLVIEEV